MRLEELGGTVSVNPYHASTLIRVLFDPSDIVAISSKRAVRTTGSNVLTQGLLASDLVQSLEAESGRDLLYSLCTEPDMMDTYFGLAPIKPDHVQNIHRRVRTEDVENVIMLYADLDVKDGAFVSQAEAMSFIGSLPFKPNAVVSSGSGGLHVYWKVRGFDGSRGLGIHLGKDFLIRWWAYLRDHAGGRKIDRLIDTTRMSRLPGTVRWPRADSGEGAAPVELLHASRGEEIFAADLMVTTETAWRNLQNERASVRRRDEQITVATEEIAKAATGGRWSKLLAVAQMEDWVNETIPWSSILEPVGWTYLREDGQGRAEWARPGRMEKSATVDWPDSPHVMSLLSTSEDTGLADLLDAEIVLTKFRVMLRLNFADDSQAAVSWVLTQMGS